MNNTNYEILEKLNGVFVGKFRNNIVLPDKFNGIFDLWNKKVLDEAPFDEHIGPNLENLKKLNNKCQCDIQQLMLSGCVCGGN